MTSLNSLALAASTPAAPQGPTDQAVLEIVGKNPGQTTAEIKSDLKIEGLRKKAVNQILYRLQGEGKVIRKQEGTEAPTWWLPGSEETPDKDVAHGEVNPQE